MGLQKQVLSGAFWSLTGQIGFMAIGLLTNIILARLLSPFEFGQMGVLMFFIVIANIFTESGFGGALVRKKDVTHDDYSTAFVFNLGVSVFCCVLLIAISKPISVYYKDPQLQKLLIVVSSVLLIGAISFTQQAKLVRELKFKKIAIFQLVAVVVSSVFSLYLAYKGFGIWALVAFQLCTPFLIASLQITFGGAFFSLRFNKQSFKHLFGFGVNTTGTALIATAFDNIYSLILGRYFSINQAGFYYQAKRLQDVPLKIFSTMVHGVVFSSLVKLQDEKARFIVAYNRITLLLTILMGGIFSFIFLYADSIIWLLYGEKWMGAVFFMKLLSIGSFFYFQELLNLVIFKAFNQTKRVLQLEIVKKIIQSVSIFLGVYYLNIFYLVYGFVISSMIGYLLNYHYSRKVLGKFDWFELLIMVKVILTCITSILVCKYLMFILNLNHLSCLFLIPVFVVLFLIILILMKAINLKEEFNVFINLIKQKTK